MNSEKKGKEVGVYIIPTETSENERTSKAKTFWHIDKEMLKFKLHFFLFIGGQAAALPFIVVFAKDRIGISASSLGAVLTVQMFLFIFSKPIIGYIADYFNKLKIIIFVLTIVNATCYFILLAIPSIEFYNVHNSSKSPFDGTTDVLNSKLCDDLCLNISLINCNVNLTGSSHPNLKKHDMPRKAEEYVGNTMSSKNITKIKTTTILYNGHDSVQLLPCTCEQISLVQDLTELCCGQSSNLSQKLNSSSISECVITCNGTEIYLASCGSQKKPMTSVSNSTVSNGVKRKDIETYQFWIFALIFTTSSVCSNAIFTLSDTACYEGVQKTGADFGRQRLWGAIGWGSIAPLAGFINDYTKDYLAAFIIMAIMMILFLWNISRIDLVKPHFSKNIFKDVSTVLGSRDFLAFEAMVLMNGIGTGMIWFYLIWFLTSIGGSELLCGLTLTVQSFLGAIPFMFFSGWIIKKVGHFNVLILALATYVLRFLWYSYLKNPWLVLPVEIAHGITYGLYYTTLASYGKLSAKPGTEATTQAVLFSTHEGLGCGIGCVLAGISFDYVGGHKTFFFAGIFSICGVVVSLILSALFRNRKGIVRLTSTTDTVNNQ